MRFTIYKDGRNGRHYFVPIKKFELEEIIDEAIKNSNEDITIGLYDVMYVGESYDIEISLNVNDNEWHLDLFSCHNEEIFMDLESNDDGTMEDVANEFKNKNGVDIYNFVFDTISE